LSRLKDVMDLKSCSFHKPFVRNQTSQLLNNKPCIVYLCLSLYSTKAYSWDYLFDHIKVNIQFESCVCLLKLFAALN
jgi:hypothetical protein